VSAPKPARFGPASLGAFSAVCLGRGLHLETHQAHSCADHPQAQNGRPAARRGQDRHRGLPCHRGDAADLPPLAAAGRRPACRGSQAADPAGTGTPGSRRFWRRRSWRRRCSGTFVIQHSWICRSSGQPWNLNASETVTSAGNLPVAAWTTEVSPALSSTSVTLSAALQPSGSFCAAGTTSPSSRQPLHREVRMAAQRSSAAPALSASSPATTRSCAWWGRC